MGETGAIAELASFANAWYPERIKIDSVDRAASTVKGKAYFNASYYPISAGNASGWYPFDGKIEGGGFHFHITTPSRHWRPREKGGKDIREFWTNRSIEDGSMHLGECLNPVKFGQCRDYYRYKFTMPQ